MAKQLISTKTQQIEKANSVLFATVVIASIVVSFSLVFVQILWKQGRFNARVISAQEVVRDDLKWNIETIPKLEAELVVLENADDLIKGQGDKTNSQIVLDALPSEYNFPAIATSFDSLAKKSGVKLTTFKGQDLGDAAPKTSPEPTPTEILFDVGVEGSYENIVKFINSLEVSIRPMKVKKLALAGNTGKLTLDLSLSTYYQPAIDLNLTKRTVE